MATRKKKAAGHESSPELEALFEKLKKQIVEGEPPGVIAILAGLDEESRKALSDRVYKLHQDLWAGRVMGRGKFSYSNSPLAVMAVCELAKAKRVHLHAFHGPYQEQVQQAHFALLSRRSPAWINSYVQAQIELRESNFSWELIDGLMSSGVPIEATDRLIIHLGERFNTIHHRLAERLRERPHLMALIPRLFEVPHGGFAYTLSNHRERYPNFQPWGEALDELAQSGELSRQDLLSWSLDALNRDFPPAQLGAMCNFHTGLKPSPEEKQALEARYRELLGSPTPKVVGFAVKSCLSLKKLDQKAFLQAAVPALRTAGKTTASSLLKAVLKMALKQPDLHPECAEIAREGELHAAREVADLAREILRICGEVATPTEAEEAAEVGETEEVEFDLEGIDPRWVSFFHLDCPADRLPLPLHFEIHQVPFRRTRVTPIADLYELIDSISAAVEECRSGDEIERILDGLSRLADQRPPDFGARTAALKKRIETMPGSEAVKGLTSGWGGMSTALNDLFVSWLERRMVITNPHSWAKPSQLLPFRQGLLQELARRLVEGRPAPLLSAPTHQGGWVAAEALVERMRRIDPPRHRYDLVAAMLRLAPHHRGQALPAARRLGGEEGRALCWALGAAEGPRATDRRGELWLAAGRARDPRGELTEALGFPEPARHLSWSAVPGKSPAWSGPPEIAEVSKPVAALKGLVSSVKSLFSRARPAPELDPVGGCYGGSRQAWNQPDTFGVWNLHWRALVWPANLDSYWKQASVCLAERIDSDGSASFPNEVHLEPLFFPDRPWDNNAMLPLWLATVSKASEIRLAAVDLLIEGISDGRAHPEPLGSSLLAVQPGGYLKPNRLAESLRQVARTGELHRWTVARVLERCMERLPERGAHELLDALLETATDGLQASTRQALAGVKIGGKSGALLARLRELPEYRTTLAIRSLLLAARLERARAWTTTGAEVPG